MWLCFKAGAGPSTSSAVMRLTERNHVLNLAIPHVGKPGSGVPGNVTISINQSLF